MPPDRPAIAIVGSTNLDLVASVARAPRAGETVLATAFERGFGGKGANQAVMAARFNADVTFIGAVGDDPFGDPMARNLREAGVATDRLAVVPGPSGTAQIWVEPDGTNRIVVIPGANGAVEAGAVAAAVEALPALDVLVGQLEIPQSATIAGYRAARARGAATILNPAPAVGLDEHLLAMTDWLVPNEGELERLAGGAATSDAELRAFASRMERSFVVTLGAAGAVLVTPDAVVRVPAPAVMAVDSTGAGDAFVGAFAVGLASPAVSIADAVRLGVACASDSVTRAGAQASYPDRARVAELLAQAISQPSGPGTNARSSG